MGYDHFGSSVRVGVIPTGSGIEWPFAIYSTSASDFGGGLNDFETYTPNSLHGF